jgi:hypothetical protein
LLATALASACISGVGELHLQIGVHFARSSGELLRV